MSFKENAAFSANNFLNRPVIVSNNVSPTEGEKNNVQVYAVSKRLMDIVISSLCLLFLLPLCLIITALLMWEGGAPIFAHKRVGYRNSEFLCYKFRSMRRDADAVLDTYLKSNPDAAREWETSQKLECDPRVTRLGRFLRRSSIDEIPQFINVIRGDMSLVGPRPIVRAELEKYGPYAADYLSIKPGLTGLWQVSGRSNLTYEQRVGLDAHYVANRALWMDLKILAQTALIVIRREGAV
jgi:lipopolysaccharide/colanic/teichoic acid biosynthesis glycosyltransferase